MKNRFIPLIALVAVSIVTTNAQTLIFDDFNNATTGFGNFQAQSASSIAGFDYSSTAGVGGVGPGRVNATGAATHTGTADYVGAGAAITWAAGQEYGVSILFTGTFGTGNINQVTTGAIRSIGSNFAGGGSGLWGQLRQNGSGDPFLRMFQQNTQVGANSDSFTLTSGTWYEIETRFTLTNATTAATFGVYLFDRGTDGTAARSLVESVTATNVAIGNNGFSNATLYTSFGGGNNSGSPITAFDNFSVTAIPEPSSAFLLLSGIALLIRSRRRRRG